jgi:hypothetical protein
LSIGALALAAATVFAPVAAVQAAAAPPAAPSAVAPAITGAQVVARAETWHPHTAQRIPYSQGP